MPLDAVCLQAVVAELAPQITGSRIEGWNRKRFIDSLLRASFSADQVSKTLHNYTTAQHVAEFCNTLSIFIGILEGL